MQKTYDYPLDLTWTSEEIITVMALYQAVEKAYESKISRDDFLKTYDAFKKVVPSKSEEKQIGNLFEQKSGYSLYRVLKVAKETNGFISMGE